MRTFLATAIVGLMASFTDAASHRGSCSDSGIAGASGFNISTLSGRWYEIARDSDFADTANSCLVEDVTASSGLLNVKSSGYTVAEGWQQKTVLAAQRNNGRAEFVTYTEGETPDRSAATEVFILTGNASYLIEYLCYDLVPGYLYFDSIAVKARQPTLTDATLSAITSLIESRLPGYKAESLYYNHQCSVCPFNTIPQ